MINFNVFKNIDRKIADLGFKEVRNDKYGIVYERNNGIYIHTVALLHKNNGQNILQSYDPALYDAKAIGNTSVGLSYRELVLFTKKMKRLEKEKNKWRQMNIRS